LIAPRRTAHHLDVTEILACRIALWLCLILFVARVLGQVYVGLYRPRGLPPWEDWYSGLLPYPWLLASQVLIIMVMTMVAYDHSRGEGWMIVRDDRAALVIRWFAVVYAGGMALRYILTMARHAERRWFKGTIPIWFHLVLAAFLYLVATFPGVEQLRSR
jgi:hypothetical protein